MIERRMCERGARAERSDDLQERFSLLHGTRPTIDTGQIRRQVHRHPITELNQISSPRLYIWRQYRCKRRRKDVFLIAAKEAPPENPELDDAPLAFFFLAFSFFIAVRSMLLKYCAQ